MNSIFTQHHAINFLWRIAERWWDWILVWAIHSSQRKRHVNLNNTFDIKVDAYYRRWSALLRTVCRTSTTKVINKYKVINRTDWYTEYFEVQCEEAWKKTIGERNCWRRDRSLRDAQAFRSALTANWSNCNVGGQFTKLSMVQQNRGTWRGRAKGISDG